MSECKENEAPIEIAAMHPDGTWKTEEEMSKEVLRIMSANGYSTDAVSSVNDQPGGSIPSVVGTLLGELRRTWNPQATPLPNETLHAQENDSLSTTE